MADAFRLSAEDEQRLAAAINGEVWRLLMKDERSAEDDVRMLHAAHASCFHWANAGTAVHEQRGEWLISRVYAQLGCAEAALRHARRCRALTEAHAEIMADFDRAYAHEALARAAALSGDAASAREHLRQAESLGEAIVDVDDRRIFRGDLEGGNWFGLR